MRLYILRTYIGIFVLRLVTKLLFIDTPPVLSVAAIISKNNKILFVDHSYLEGYGLPGGIVREGESLEVAISREVSEETGLKVKDIKYFRSYADIKRGIPTIIVVFEASASGSLVSSREGTPIFLNPHKVKKYSYVNTKLTIRDFLKK